MTNNNHPITPSPVLVQHWIDEEDGVFAEHIATQAARWGADMELNACCEWLNDNFDHCNSSDRTDWLRAARRPKPLSLKAQALEALKHAEEGWRPVPADCEIIRRALEQLDD